MKQSLKQDTLAYQLGVRPAVLHRDMSSASVKKIVGMLNKYRAGATTGTLVGMDTGENPCQGNPERDALAFYMLNHAVSLVRQKYHPYERLGDSLKILETYHEQLAVTSARMFFYLLAICARESRHAKSLVGSAAGNALKKAHGEKVLEFYTVIKTANSSQHAAEIFMKAPPDLTLGTFTKYMSDLFYKGSFNSSYGGKNWGAIADVLRDYSCGVITAEMMMDTAFTLAHNTGPIFNKGMLYEGSGPELARLLDVQRSGQIPQYIGNNETHWASDPKLSAYWELCRDILGGQFEGHVDWFLVEELGALKTYKTEKESQIKKYGYPSKFKAKIETEKMKATLAEKKVQEEALLWVQITPHLKVKKVQPVRAS